MKSVEKKKRIAKAERKKNAKRSKRERTRASAASATCKQMRNRDSGDLESSKAVQDLFFWDFPIFPIFRLIFAFSIVFFLFREDRAAPGNWELGGRSSLQTERHTT